MNIWVVLKEVIDWQIQTLLMIFYVQLHTT
jgi:hypothetical protein